MADELARLAVEVEGAPSGSEELSARVLCAVLAPPGSKVEQSRINGAWCVYAPSGHGTNPFRLFDRWPASMRLNREITTSLDAVVTLIHERLPGWEWGRDHDGVMWIRSPPGPLNSCDLFADSPDCDDPARGLLAATLKALALASQEKADA